MRILRTIPLFLGLAAIWLFISGCSGSKPEVLDNPPEVLQPQVEVSFIGRIDTISGDILEVSNVDGVLEEVRFSENIPSDLSVGDLLEISGGRDKSTQIISALSWKKLDRSNFYIISPTNGSTVTSPIFINGFFPGSFGGLLWSIETSDGRTQQGELRIIEGNILAIVPFYLELFPLATTNRELNITLKPLNATNDSASETRTVNLLSLKTTPITLYFPKDIKACGIVLPLVREISETASVPRAALEELFAGPTTIDYENGFSTALADLSSPTVVIQDGVAEVRLNAELSASSCERSTAEAQIRATLEAIPFVTEVRFLVE